MSDKELLAGAAGRNAIGSESEARMTRDEHLAWAKQRALQYLDAGDVKNAVTSMLSDLSKHDELKRSGSAMGMYGIMIASRRDHAEARRFIEGFN